MKKKILIIVSKIKKDFRHLYALVDNQEYNMHKTKILSFYENKKKELDKMENENYHYFIKTLQNFYGKENVFVFNQEVDNKMQELGIEVTNLHGNITERKKNGEDFNIILKDEDGKYPELIEKIDNSHLLLFIGNLGNADPSLFIEEMTDSIYINTEEEYQDTLNKTTVSSFFDEFIIDDLNKPEVADKLFIKIKNKVSVKPFFINKEKPFEKNQDFVENKILKYIDEVSQKHKLGEFSTILGMKLKKIYPFLEKYPDTFIENIWYAFCSDTNNIKIMDKPFETSLFYDMFLVYTVFRWEGIKKTLYKTPKISLLEAYINDDLKSIKIFKNLLLKKENVLINTIK